MQLENNFSFYFANTAKWSLERYDQVTETIYDNYLGKKQTQPNIVHVLLLRSVQSLSRIWLFITHELQHIRLPYPSPTPGACANSCPSSWWCHATISSSVVPFSSCLQSFPASRSFQMSQFFTLGGQGLGLQLQHEPFKWIFMTDLL